MPASSGNGPRRLTRDQSPAPVGELRSRWCGHHERHAGSILKRTRSEPENTPPRSSGRRGTGNLECMEQAGSTSACMLELDEGEENAMPLRNDYFSAYQNLKLTRDDKGVLVAEFRSNGGPCIMTAQSHTEFVDAFYRISQDRANKIVILTGAGGDSLPVSIGPLSATSPTPACGAKFMMKAFRFWKT